MDLEKLNSEVIRIKNLRQYKNYSPEKLQELAHNRLLTNQVDIDTLFVDKNDKNVAKILLKKYLNDYTPETISDINILRSILFLEVLNNRFQEELNKKHSEGEDIPLKTAETIHKNLNEILVLKDAIGLTRDKKSSSEKSVESKLKLIKKQFKAWGDENQASRNATCPYCGQMFLLRIRMNHWEEQKHMFFKDRILYNQKLVELYLEKKLTKEEIGEILECSPDYLDWLVERMWTTNPHYKTLVDPPPPKAEDYDNQN